MSRKKNDYGTQIGSSSLLLIFVVLCLVSFAALAIVSANADSKLTEKLKNRTAAYYTACSQAQENLADIDAQLQEAYASVASDNLYYASVQEQYSFTVPFTDSQELSVTVVPQYPRKAGEPYYRIISWKVKNITSPEFDTTLPVLQ